MVWDTTGQEMINKKAHTDEAKLWAKKIKDYKVVEGLSWNDLHDRIDTNWKESDIGFKRPGSSDTLKHQINRASPSLLARFQHYYSVLSDGKLFNHRPINSAVLSEKFLKRLVEISEEATDELSNNE